MDLSNLCRSCMKEVASWERENFSKRAVDMFCFCTNIKITDGEELPKQFCYDCVIKIESAFMFIKEAQNVNITLRNIVSRNETRVIIEPESFKQIDFHEKPASTLKLTLPDYKLCSTIISSTEQVNKSIVLENSIPTDVNTGYPKDVSIYTLDASYIQVNTELSKPTEVTNMDTSDLQENTDQYESLDAIETNLDIQEVCNERTEEKVETEKNTIELQINSEKKNICPICRKSFTSKVWFSKHMEKEHSGKKYTCAQCPKTFSKPSQVAYHSVSHSEERKFPCNVCGKRFKLRKQLMTHARGHSDVRPYACDKCAMRFKMKSVLKCHMKVHEEQKQYLCSYCGWSFAQASNLAMHIRTHTGAKPHACSVCSFRAASASSVRRHERAHRDARTHLCNHCRKPFLDASALARHTRTHTGELPYQCPGCTRAFADSWKRKTHLMRAHRIALHDIPPMRRDGRPL